MTTIAQGQHAYIFPEPGQVYRVQATGVATVQVIYGAPSDVITLDANSQTFGPYDSPAKLRISANTAAADYTLIRAHYAELTQAQLEGGAVGVLASDNVGGAIEPDGDVPNLGGSVTLPAMQLAFDAGTTPQKTAFQASVSVVISAIRSLYGGAVGAHAGASMTNGAGSSNAGTTSWSAKLANGLPVTKAALGARLLSAHPGQPLTYIATQMDSLAGCDYLVLGCDNGTNGSGIGGALIPHADWVAAFNSIASKVKSWGVPMIVCLTIPAASSQDAQAHIEIRRRNAYLLLNAAKRGYKIIDTHSPLMDRATGYLAAAYDSGDGVHPNDAGHLLIANLLIAYISTILPDVAAPVGLPGVAGTIPLGLLTNPLMVGTSGTLPTGWISGTGTLTGLTSALVNPSADVDLPQGRWLKQSLTAGAAGNRRYQSSTPNDATSVQPGDLVLICFRAMAEGAVCTVTPRLMNSNTSAVLYNWPNAGTTPTEYRLLYTVPAGVTRLTLIMDLASTAAGAIAGYFGMADIINITRQSIA